MSDPVGDPMISADPEYPPSLSVTVAYCELIRPFLTKSRRLFGI